MGFVVKLKDLEGVVLSSENEYDPIGIRSDLLGIPHKIPKPSKQVDKTREANVDFASLFGSCVQFGMGRKRSGKIRR